MTRRCPVLPRGKTDTRRLWVYVRDDRPFGGGAPPAALFRYSRDRRGEHPKTHLSSWQGILPADACPGFGNLYDGDRQPGRAVQALSGPMPGASSSSSPTSPRPAGA